MPEVADQPKPRTLRGRGKSAFGNAREARNQCRIALEKLATDPDSDPASEDLLRRAYALLSKADAKLCAKVTAIRNGMKRLPR